MEIRLEPLLNAQLKSKKNLDKGFDVSPGLSQARQSAWASLLTSLATSENIESLILEPLVRRYRGQEVLRSYLQRHGEDEVKHYRWLTEYIAQSFGPQPPRKKSLSSLLFYDFALPRLSHLAETQASFLFALMLFYEAFTIEFYKALRRQAQVDGLTNLVDMIGHIEKDELRHCKAASELLKFSVLQNQNGFGYLKTAKHWMLLKLFQLDMSTEWWCIHNRRVRRSTLELGISPRNLRQMSQIGIDRVLRDLKEVL
jgi:hypothetical protein